MRSGTYGNRRQATAGHGPLRRLKLIGVFLPVLIVVALEAVTLDSGGTSALAALVVGSAAAIAGFGAWMFHLINRALESILDERAAQEAATRIAVALRAEETVDSLLVTACTRIRELTDAQAVVIELSDGSARRAAGALPAPGGAALTTVLLPLRGDTGEVGQLSITGPQQVLAVTPREVLADVAVSLGRALQSARQLQQLRQRDQASQHLHAILLRISGQEPLTDTLGSVADSALELLPAERILLRVREETAREVLSDSHFQVTSVFARPTSQHLPDPSQLPAEPVVSSADIRGSQEVPLAVLSAFGSRELDPAQREVLCALADVAGVALTSALARVHEQHCVILDERQRIARELHDSLAQVLAVTHLRLRTVQARCDVSAIPELHTEVGDVADICAEAYSDVREAILGLHESSHRHRDLAGNLQAFLVKYSQQCGITARLELDLGGQQDLGPHVELQLVRVIQEALANARKHSEADNVVVRIARGESSTIVTICDDGIGFDLQTAQFRRDGYGLYTMRERLALLGGSLRIESSPGWGTNIIAEVPGHRRRAGRGPEMVNTRERHADPTRPG